MTHQILPATDLTMTEIEAWLDAEEAAHKAGMAAWKAGGAFGDYDDIPARGFRCNWDNTKKLWREHSGGIDILVVDGEAIGFQGFSIFEIRPDLRGKGYGRILAEFMISRAFEDGWSLLEIGIAPDTAIPFWERMGFTLVPDRQDNGGGIFAYKILPRKFDLGGGGRVPFLVEFFTEEEKYGSDGRPFSTFSGFGERLADGGIQLPERAYCFQPLEDVGGNAFVRIEIDGRELHFDKLKRESSRVVGLECDPGYTYFLDRICVTDVQFSS